MKKVEQEYLRRLKLVARSKLYSQWEFDSGDKY